MYGLLIFVLFLLICSNIIELKPIHLIGGAIVYYFFFQKKNNIIGGVPSYMKINPESSRTEGYNRPITNDPTPIQPKSRKGFINWLFNPKQ